MPLQIILAPDGTFTIGGLEPAVVDVLAGSLVNEITGGNPLRKLLTGPVLRQCADKPELCKIFCDQCVEAGNSRQLAEFLVLLVPFHETLSKSHEVVAPVNPDEQAG